MDAGNFDTIDDHPLWLQGDSPWADARKCFWPLDDADLSVCALGDSASGWHTCAHDTPDLDQSEWRWCGSHFDALGNARFKG